MTKVIRRQLSVVFVICMIVAISGYITFANEPSQIASGNILNANYQKNFLVTLVINLFISLKVKIYLRQEYLFRFQC